MDTHTHIHTYIHTYTQDNYSNPRCACAPRVNESIIESMVSTIQYIVCRVLCKSSAQHSFWLTIYVAVSFAGLYIFSNGWQKAVSREKKFTIVDLD